MEEFRAPLWYESGVHPTFLSVISSYPLKNSKKRTRDIIEEGQIYAERFGVSNDYLLFPDFHGLTLLINDPLSLADKVHFDPFNAVAKKPFMFFTISQLLRSPGFWSDKDLLEGIAVRTGLYLLENERNKFVALTKDTSAPFIRSERRESIAGGLTQMINEYYRQFQDWRPGREPYTHKMNTLIFR